VIQDPGLEQLEVRGKIIKKGIYVGHAALSFALAGIFVEISFEMSCLLLQMCVSIRDAIDSVYDSSAVE